MNELEVISQGIYGEIRQSIIHIQQNVQKAVNAGMVQIYWEVGQRLDEACDGKRAEYGKGLIQSLSERLTAEFGKGYSVQGLRNMRQFYQCFPIRSALRSELSLRPYLVLMQYQRDSSILAKDRGAYRWRRVKPLWRRLLFIS